MSIARDLGLLAGRVVLGGYLIAHGAQKLYGAFGGPGLDAAASGFEQLGLRPGEHMARAASISEMGGGILTIAGVANPLGPMVLAGTMAVASSTHRPNGPFAANGGYELPLSNMAAALALAAAGPGRIRLGPALPKRLARFTLVGVVTSAAVLISGAVRESTASSSPAAPEDQTGSPEDETETLTSQGAPAEA